MGERCIRFGNSNQLNGVLAVPDELNADRPAVIILNSGVMHHVGACRMSVRIARDLAKQGFLSLRFDHAGIGDSEPHKGQESFEQFAPEEVIQAMDYLQKRVGVKRFVLYGLCSGADMSYEAALLDERAIGVIQIDAYAYRTRKFYWNYYWPRMQKASVWKNFVSNRLPVILKMKKKLSSRDTGDVSSEDLEMPSYIRVFPPQEQIEKGIKKLVDRKVALYYIFTGGHNECFNYQGQVVDMFPAVNFGDRLTVDYFADCSHIIKEPHRQLDVINGITQWVTQLV